MGRPSPVVRRPPRPGAAAAVGLAVALLLVASPARGAPTSAGPSAASRSGGPVANFTAAIDRLVDLVGLAGGGILALVWARVALSWFSNDVTKKIQAKDRARDALVGTLLFVAAVSGLIYGLAHWVVTGT
jgi:hypothetical protein